MRQASSSIEYEEFWKETGRAAIATVVRNWKGSMITGSATKIMVNSSLSAEAYAFREALIMGREVKFETQPEPGAGSGAAAVLFGPGPVPVSSQFALLLALVPFIALCRTKATSFLISPHFPRIEDTFGVRMRMSLIRPLLARRGFSTSSEKLVASVLFERLPVVIPKVDPVVYAFQEFSFRWRQQFQRRYPDEFLDKSNARGKGDYQIDYVPAPRITEADKTNDRKSLQRALDRRLYLLLFGNTYGAPSGKPVWHFPEKVYESEENMRKCAETALKSIIGDLSHTYFVGNAPMGHMVVQPTEDTSKSTPFKRFFFKSQVIAKNKFNIGKCEDFVWVTKDELLEYFPEQAEFLNKMILS
ncbi:39S ribosomal protein [Arachis hypogaea]|nr:39S ribosomal protein [Arachis hypogaea]